MWRCMIGVVGTVVVMMSGRRRRAGINFEVVGLLGCLVVKTTDRPSLYTSILCTWFRCRLPGLHWPRLPQLTYTALQYRPASHRIALQVVVA